MFGFGKRSIKIAAEETRSLAAPTDLDFSIFGAAPVLAGVSVSPASALSVPAVAAGVKAISEACSILPLHVYERRDDGSRERLTDHPAYRLLNAEANPWTQGPQLRDLITADALAYGNGYALIVRDRDQQPTELHRLYPPSVTIELDSLTGEPRYKAAGSPQARFVPYSDILHLRAPSSLSTDSICGKSPLLQASTAIAILILLQRHAGQLFASGGRPAGVLSFPKLLGAEAAKRIKASWQTATSGGNAGGTAVLEEDGKFTPLAFSSVDAQFLEIWGHSIMEVARVLRVPPVLLMDYSRQTWANAETGGQQFLTYSLAPWLARWEAELTLKLIPQADRKTLFTEHLVDALLRSDFASRATAYSQYRSMGALTANEVRAGLNLPRIEGGDEIQNPYTTSANAAPAPAVDPAKDDKPNE